MDNTQRDSLNATYGYVYDSAFAYTNISDTVYQGKGDFRELLDTTPEALADSDWSPMIHVLDLNGETGNRDRFFISTKQFTHDDMELVHSLVIPEEEEV